MTNLTTLKIPYQTANEEDLRHIQSLSNKYTSLFHCTYNFIKNTNKLDTKSITSFQHSLSNVELNSWFRASCIYEAKALAKSENVLKNSKKCIFNRGLLFKRIKNLINREEFLNQKRMKMYLYSIGDQRLKGNRLFQILNENTILFKPDRKHHINLNIKCSKNYRKLLNRLIVHQEQKDLAITYKLDSKFVYLTFNLNKVIHLEAINRLADRIVSIDMNPNYIGLSVIDWKNNDEYKLIHKGVVSIKTLNDFENNLKVSSESKEHKYITDKRHDEIIKIVQYLTTLCNHYRCSTFAIEDLNTKSKDRNIRRLNKLCNNQWCRMLFTRVLEKYCNLYSIRLQRIEPAYSSFMGNLVYRNERLPDMILSSIEISRRCYNFIHQYLVKDQPIKKNIIFDDSLESNRRVVQSLEELNCLVDFNDYQELYEKMKKSKCKYRFPLEGVKPSLVFSTFSMKSMIKTMRF